MHNRDLVKGILFWMNVACICGVAFVVILTYGRKDLIYELSPKNECFGYLVNYQSSSKSGFSHGQETIQYLCKTGETLLDTEVTVWNVSYSYTGEEVLNKEVLEKSFLEFLFIPIILIIGFVVGPYYWMSRVKEKSF